MSYGLNRITPSGGSALDSIPSNLVNAPAPNAVAAAPGAGFALGTRVVIRGLKAQPEFNGCSGRIVSPEENGRWGVELDQGDGIKVSACSFRDVDLVICLCFDCKVCRWRHSMKTSTIPYVVFLLLLMLLLPTCCISSSYLLYFFFLLVIFVPFSISGPQLQSGKLRHCSAASRVR